MTDYSDAKPSGNRLPNESRPAPARAGNPEVLERHRSVPEAAEPLAATVRSSSCTMALRTPTAAFTSVTRSTRFSRTSLSAQDPWRATTRPMCRAGIARPAHRAQGRDHPRQESSGGQDPRTVPRIRSRRSRAEGRLHPPGRARRVGQPYKTMNFANEANEIRALAEMVKQDFVFKGLKPVNWCFDCGSALAEAEVEYADKSRRPSTSASRWRMPTSWPRPSAWRPWTSRRRSSSGPPRPGPSRPTRR